MTRYDAYVNTTRYSTPVYTVTPQQPNVRVVLDRPPSWKAGLRAAFAQVPIPDSAQPAADSDAHMVVWQPCTDKLWEFWRARRAADGWHAVDGGAMTDVSQNPGYYPSPLNWGATASGLSLLGGLIRIEELHEGEIPHAVSFGLPEPRAGIWAWPAQRTDGTSTDPSAIPEGTRFRLDPSLDLSQLPMSRFVRILATAVQKYGMIAVDASGAVAFGAEDPTPTGSNPYLGPTGFFEGKSPVQLLQQFPWSRLQVVNAPLHAVP